MLDIFIVFLDICEHVVHVVFGRPPLHWKSTQECCLYFAKKIKVFIAIVSSRVTHPSDDHLSKAKGNDTNDGVRGGAADEPRG